MLPNIQEKFERLVQKRKSLLQHLDSLSPGVVSFKAGPDKWSVVEAIEHLVIVEDDFLEQVTTKNPDPPLDPEARSFKKYQTVIKVMKRDVPVDVPHEKMEPHGRLSLDELLDKWNDIRNKMQSFLDAITSDNQDDLIYQHPYGGPLNIAETLEFIDVHFDNHMRHIDTILGRVKK
jgi:hypothetical protein